VIVAAICGAALALRVGYVLALRTTADLTGDAYQYHYGANLLVDGKGFIDPLTYVSGGRAVQTAQHPPLYTLVLAIPSALGLRSVLAHQLWSCALGAATVSAVAVLGRRVAGARVGLAAAWIAAFAPSFWVSDGLVLSETLFLLLVTLVLLAAYHLWDARTPRAAVVLGVVCALAALTRAEATLFLPLLVLLMIAFARDLALRRCFELAGLAVVAAGLVFAPWVAFNLSRFHHRVLGASTGFDLALVQSNCPATYYGGLIGSRTATCLPLLPAGTDETDANRYYRAVARTYVTHHLARVPLVVAARIGRAWGLYQPTQEMRLDAFVERREIRIAEWAYLVYVGLAVAAVPGAVLLRRRRVPLFPMVAMAVTVTVAVVITFGQARYRVSVEPVLAVLVAVTVDEVLRRRSHLASGATGEVDERRDAAPDAPETPVPAP